MTIVLHSSAAAYQVGTVPDENDSPKTHARVKVRTAVFEPTRRPFVRSTRTSLMQVLAAVDLFHPFSETLGSCFPDIKATSIPFAVLSSFHVGCEAIAFELSPSESVVVGLLGFFISAQAV